MYAGERAKLMALKERTPFALQVYMDQVVNGLAAPISAFDIFLDLHLGMDPQEADALALREDWLVVGECIRDAMHQQAQAIVPSRGDSHER